MKNITIFFFVFVFSLGTVSCSHIQRNPSGIWETVKSYVPFLNSEDELSKELNQFLQRVRAEVPNHLGIFISAFSSLSEVDSFITEFETFNNKLNGTALKNDLRIRSIYVEVATLVIGGRGNQTPRDGSGWTYSRNYQEAFALIQRITSQGVLDDISKKQLKDYLLQVDKDDFKKQRGFPPQFELVQAAQSQELLKTFDKAKTVKTPYVAGNLNDIQLTADIIQNSTILNEMEKKALLQNFIGGMENNLYDESVSTLLENKEFIDYFGRDREVNEVIDILSRLEKGHVLLTGKAGVGKTTILKILQDRLVQKKISIANEEIPIILELSIVDLTNPSDPSAIKAKIELAKLLSTKLKRRVILYVDEAHIATNIVKNAIKSFLTEKSSKTKVHFIWSTTSEESRQLMSDTAFNRRWGQVAVSEFTKEESILLIKKTYLNQWKKHHQLGDVKFGSISEDAYEFAAKYFNFEQPHAGNPTGIKEFLEAAIARKKRVLSEEGFRGEFNLDIGDLREYLKNSIKLSLIPGDPNFNNVFQEKWEKFDSEYVGNDGFKSQFKEELYSTLSSMESKKMSAWVLFGAPGGGKSYAAEKVAEHFYDSAKLIINAAEYKNGGLELNKLLGSPSGTVGSEEQRSILTKFLSENKRGLIVIEEADYAHQDFLQVFTNMITEGKVRDGLGKEWNTSQFAIMMTSNIGQEFMISPDSKNKMTWEQYLVRKNQLLEKIKVGDSIIEIPKKEVMDKIFDNFAREIVTKSNPGVDTSIVSQEANKQKRRMKSFYVLSPDQNELLAAAKVKLGKFMASMKLDYGVEVKLDKSFSLDKVIDIDNYEFEKGYSYIEEQLEDKIFRTVRSYSQDKEINLALKVEEGNTNLIVRTEKSQDLFQIFDQKLASLNPWASSQTMNERISQLVPTMGSMVKGMSNQILETKKLLMLKKLDWNTNVVITQIGTSGNGKTEFAKSLATSLYGDQGALFKITADHKYQLNDYFRPPTAFVGANEETEFERWFKARKNAGGGVILFDELLSYAGLSGQALSDKVAIINSLYDLLDEGKLKIGNKVEDARSFVVVVTGNLMQEMFAGIGDTPEAEELVSKVINSISKDDIVKEFARYGVDAPKVARLGKIFVNGPLSQDVTSEIAKKMTRSDVDALLKKSNKKVEVLIDEQISIEVAKRMSTIELGMREVNKGVKAIILEPLTGILSTYAFAKKVEARLKNGSIAWFVDGKEIFFEATLVDRNQKLYDENWVYANEASSSSENRTPQLSALDKKNKVNFTEQDLKIVAVHEVKGHWMVDYLLEGKNGADAISLIPGDGYLGYVRPKEKANTAMTLNQVIKKIAVLEAGHRAVFKEGIMAFGAGGSGRSEKMRNDDVAKIDNLLNAMLSNQIFENFTEYDAESKKIFFKSYFRKLGKEIADSLIEYGIKHKIADKVYEDAMRDRFLSSSYLDNLSEIKNSSQIFLDSFKSSLEKTELEFLAADGANTRMVKDLSEVLKEKFVVEFNSTNSEYKLNLNDIGALKIDCNYLLRVRGQ